MVNPFCQSLGNGNYYRSPVGFFEKNLLDPDGGWGEEEAALGFKVDDFWERKLGVSQSDIRICYVVLIRKIRNTPIDFAQFYHPSTGQVFAIGSGHSENLKPLSSCEC